MTIPFLVNYTAPSPLQGQIVCNNVRDMVSVDVQPNELPVELEYYVGAEVTYELSVRVKNLTTNATLRVSMPFSNTIFIVENSNKPNSIEFTLSPQETKQLNIQLNNEGLNESANYDKFQINLPLNIAFIENGMLIVKNSNVTILPPTTLPLEVTVQ
jgi:hypothetical protein